MKKGQVIVFLILLFSFSRAFAYDNQTTHPALTGEIIDFANANGAGITSEERAWIIEGSIQEDTAPRWVNHFYDPVNNTGWTGAKAGSLDATTLKTLADIGTGGAMPATQWVKGCGTQDPYYANGGNRSWDMGQEYYVQGNKKEAYITLGHVLHLAEDMAVPDHTRDDTHSQYIGEDDGSPYEQYANKWTPDSIKELRIAQTLTSEGKSPVSTFSAEEYLKNIAVYSNNYFFSKDTINDPRYSNPKITAQYGTFAFGKDEEGIEFPLARRTSDFDYAGAKLSANLTLEKRDSSIFDSYFTRLSRQAVLNGAGIVKLFKKQAEDAIVNKEFFVDSQHTLKNIICDSSHKFAGFNPSIVGALTGTGQMIGSALNSVGNGISTAWNGTKKVAANIFAFFGSLFGDINQNEQPEDVPGQDENSVDEPDYTTDSTDEPRTYLNAGTLPAFGTPPAVRGLATTTLKISTSTATSTPPRATSSSPLGTRLALNSTSSSPKKSPTSTAPQFAPLPSPTVLPSYGGTGGGSIALAVDQSTTTVPSTHSNHPLISEILFDAQSVDADGKTVGSDTGKEFIEIYNPTDGEFSLTGYSLKYIAETSTTSHTLALIRATTTEITTIPTKGFLLFGFSSFDPALNGGLTADVSRSGSLPNGEDVHSVAQKIKISLLDDDKKEIDSLTYDKNSIPSPGYSLERLSGNDTTCAESQASGEFLGNGCDTGENKFAARKNPRPQNSVSFPEPRTAPTAPTSSSTIGTYLANISMSRLENDFAWDSSSDFTGSTSSIVYKLYDTSSSSPVLVATTSATSVYASVGEVSRTYYYSLLAEDRDGLASATTTVNIVVPGFADNIYFYKNPTSPSDTPQYILDFRYSTRPFIPQVYAYGFQWQAIVAYLNRAPNPVNSGLLQGNGYAPANSEGVVSLGSHISAIFGLANDSCREYGTGVARYCFVLPDEDSRLALQASIPSATSSDYLTLAYYDIANGGGTFSEPDFRIVATDARKIYYEDAPKDNLPPAKPENLTTNFDELNMKLNVAWASSTDPDSADSGLTYEVNISTSTEFSTSTWASNGTALSSSTDVIFGNTYMVGVRAKDDLGGISEINSINWMFPDGFIPAILGSSVTNASQDFVVTADGAVKELDVYTTSFYKRVDWPPPPMATCYIRIYEIVDGATTLLPGGDSANTYDDWACNGGPRSFTFAAPPALLAGHSYRWTYDISGGSSYFGWPTIKFYGRATNTVGGLFSDTTLQNAKFILKSDSGILLEN